MAKLYGFSEKDGRRLRRQNSRNEHEYQNPPPKRGRWPGPPMPGLLPAKTGGSTFSGGSIASPASATVTLMVPSGTGFTTTGGTSITAYNAYTGTIAANSLIWVTVFNNKIYVATANCS